MTTNSRNQSQFEKAQWNHTFLCARGFDSRTGAKSGGIVSPEEVVVPKGTAIARLYQPNSGYDGQWWFTPWELKQIVDHFGRAGDAFATGRAEGKGIMQAVFAIRYEWRGDAAEDEHLAEFRIARTVVDLKAFFGEGDSAPSADQTQNLKPVKIQDSSQRWRPARQLFLPRFWEYADAVTHVGGGSTDQQLLTKMEALAKSRLPFED